MFLLLKIEPTRNDTISEGKSYLAHELRELLGEGMR